MTNKHWIRSAFLGLALAGLGAADGALSPAEIKSRLADKTIAYARPEPDQQMLIHLDPAGHFVRYVPCVYTEGTWWIGEDGALCLKEDSGDKAVNCLMPRFTDAGVSFSRPGGRPVFTAGLIDGERLPFG